MQLRLIVREGDFATTSHAPFSSSLARLLVEETRGKGAPNWSKLDKVVRRKWSIPLHVRDDITVEDLTELAFRAARTSRAARPRSDGLRGIGGIRSYWLASADTNAKFRPELSLSDAGIFDNDYVVLNIEHPPYGMYMLGAAPNAQALLSMLDLVIHNPRHATTARLWGALLYTSEDVGLATYVRAHYQDLNTLSGATFGIFAIEKPTSWRQARTYWARYLDDSLLRIFSALRWLYWKPYDKSECYEIAKVLNVPAGQLPCLVLFDDLDPAIVFPIPPDADYSRFFRTLFTLLNETVEGNPTGEKQDLEDRLYGDPWGYRHLAEVVSPEPSISHKLRQLPGTSWALQNAIDAARSYGRNWGGDDPALADREVRSLRLKSIVAATKVRLARDRIIAALAEPSKPEGQSAYNFQGYTVFLNGGGTAVTEQFNFYGTTNFVNRPVNTIIQDFQKSYPTDGTGNAELAEMLRLILSSEQLPQDKKEEAAVLVHEVADDVFRGKGGKVAQGGLAKIKGIVGQAADIATPVVTIASKLLELWQ